MKKLLLTSAILVCMQTLFCQDVIYLKDGSEIKARIIELTNETIKYRRYDQLDGPLRNILLPEVLMIIYEDGTRETMKLEDKPAIQTQKQDNFQHYKEPAELYIGKTSNQDLCFQGQQDAFRYYKGYKEAASWTIAATLLGGAIIGVIPAIACSTAEPQSHTFTMPDPELLKNSTYYQCYSQEAKSIKSRRVWRSFGIGVGINVAAALLIISASE